MHGIDPFFFSFFFTLANATNGDRITEAKKISWTKIRVAGYGKYTGHRSSDKETEKSDASGAVKSF